MQAGVAESVNGIEDLVVGLDVTTGQRLAFDIAGQRFLRE